MATSSAQQDRSKRRQERRERNLRFLQEQIQRDLEEEAALKGKSLNDVSIDSNRIKVWILEEILEIILCLHSNL